MKKLIRELSQNNFSVSQVVDNYIFINGNETFENNDKIKGSIIGNIWVETATQAEIDTHNQRQVFNQMQNFINLNIANGKAYFDKIKVDITIQLYGRPQTEVNPIVAEIDTLVTPLLDKINSGDYYSAITLQLPIPTINEVKALQAEVLTYASGYVADNYQ